MFDSLRARIANFILPKLTTSQTRRMADAVAQWRSFDGAAQGRRTKGFGRFHDINSEVAAGNQIIRPRARSLFHNNPLVNSAVQNMIGSIVGYGPRATSKSANASKVWNDWSAKTNFDAQLTTIARAMIVDGEVFVHITYGDNGMGFTAIPSEQVDEAKTSEVGNGVYDWQGIRFNAKGEVLGYWVLPPRLDQFASWSPPTFYDAADMLHIHRPQAVGEVRSPSWLAPVIMSAADYDAANDALLMGLKTAAMFAGVITDVNNTSGVAFDATKEESIYQTGIQPGTLMRLGLGEDVKWTTPPQAQQTNEYMRTQRQIIAAGLGVPSHFLDGDLSNANYSSIRAGLLPWRQRAEQIQWHVVVPMLLDPLWKRLQLIAGTPSAKVEWIFPGWQQVDREKDVKADALEISLGLKSRKQAVAERGWDIEHLDAEIHADAERAKALGLTFGQQPAKEEPTPEPKEESNE